MGNNKHNWCAFIVMEDQQWIL